MIKTRSKFSKAMREEQKRLSATVLNEIQRQFRGYKFDDEPEHRNRGFFTKKFFRNGTLYAPDDTVPFLEHTLCGDDAPCRHCRDELLGKMIAAYKRLGFGVFPRGEGRSVLALMTSPSHPTWLVVFYAVTSERCGLEVSHHIYASETDRFAALRQGIHNDWGEQMHAVVSGMGKKLPSKPRRGK